MDRVARQGWLAPQIPVLDAPDTFRTPADWPAPYAERMGSREWVTTAYRPKRPSRKRKAAR